MFNRQYAPFKPQLPARSPASSLDDHRRVRSHMKQQRLRKRIEEYSFIVGDVVGAGLTSVVYRGEDDSTST